MSELAESGASGAILLWHSACSLLPRMSNPHDAYVKEMLALNGVAHDLVRLGLPPRVLSGLNLQSLKRVQFDLGDNRLASPLETDFLFQVRRRKRGTAFIYVLLEHQSTADRRMAYRMLRYRSRIWEAWWAENPRSRLLPAIIPIVLYHGRRRWRFPREFSALVEPGDGTTDVAAAFHLLDSSTHKDPQWLEQTQRPATALMLYALSDIWRSTPLHRWLDARDPALLRVMHGPKAEPRAAEMTLLYFMRARETVDLSKVRPILRGRYPSLEDTMVSFADKLEQEARRKGLEEGREEGRRQMLLELLEVKFGTLEPATVYRIENASAGELKIWLRRIVTAGSLAAVFDG